MAIQFNVQDDTGTVSGANAYITEAEFLQYWENHGVDYSAKTSDELQVAIIRGTEYVDQRFRYQGVKLTEGQSTEWPRDDVTDCRGDYVDGVPQEVKDATAEYAGRYLDNGSLQDDNTDGDSLAGRITKEKVGPIEVGYEGGIGAGGSQSFNVYPTADNILKSSCLIVSGNFVSRA